MASPSHRGIISRTQLRSLARKHAAQAQPKPKSISQFGGGLTPDSLPPTSDSDFNSQSHSHSHFALAFACALTEHSQNTCNPKSCGAKNAGAQDHAPTKQTPTEHARNTHESSGPTLKNDQHLNAITNHRSESKKLKLSIGTSARTTDERMDDRPHKFVRRALATEESSRARSFVRSHARTQRNRNRNRNRFPGSGVG